MFGFVSSLAKYCAVTFHSSATTLSRSIKLVHYQVWVYFLLPRDDSTVIWN